MLRSLYRAASSQDRRRLHWLLLLMPVAAFAEMAAIGAVVPLIGALTNANHAGGEWLNWLFDLGSADQRGEKMRLAAILFVVASIAAAVMRLILF